VALIPIERGNTYKKNYTCTSFRFSKVSFYGLGFKWKFKNLRGLFAI